jgi:hypothetical protein
MRKKYNALFCTFALFFLGSLSPNTGFGQSYQSFKYAFDQVIEQTKWRIGPFRIYPTLQFKDIGYDDNVYYQRKEEDPVSDYTGTISPQFKIHLLFRNNLILTFTENPEYVFYYRQRRERRWNNIMSQELKYFFMNRFVLSGKYIYMNRRRRGSSEFDVRANELREGFEGSLFYETARGTSLGISISSEKISYEDITLPGEEIYLSQTLNREEKNGHFEFYYKVFSKSFFFIRGGYTEYRFAYARSSWRNSYSYQAYTGIRFPLLGRVRGTLSLGYKKLVPRREGKSPFSGLVGDTSLDFKIWRLGFHMAYKRDCQFSYWTHNIFFNEYKYTAGLSFYLTRILRVDYRYNYGELAYPESVRHRTRDGSYVEIKRKDQHLIHSIGFVFRVIRNSGIGIRVNFWEWTSNILGVDRNRMFVGGYITHQF